MPATDVCETLGAISIKKDRPKSQMSSTEA